MAAGGRRRWPAGRGATVRTRSGARRRLAARVARLSSASTPPATSDTRDLRGHRHPGRGPAAGRRALAAWRAERSGPARRRPGPRGRRASAARSCWPRCGSSSTASRRWVYRGGLALCEPAAVVMLAAASRRVAGRSAPVRLRPAAVVPDQLRPLPLALAGVPGPHPGADRLGRRALVRGALRRVGAPGVASYFALEQPIRKRRWPKAQPLAITLVSVAAVAGILVVSTAGAREGRAARRGIDPAAWGVDVPGAPRSCSSATPWRRPWPTGSPRSHRLRRQPGRTRASSAARR